MHKHNGKNKSKHKLNIYLYNAIHKYGWENFNFCILSECKSDNELSKKELFWIDYFSSSDRSFGYNIVKSDSGFYRHSAETKNKISKINKGRKRTKEQCDKNKLLQKNIWDNLSSSEKMERQIKAYAGKKIKVRKFYIKKIHRIRQFLKLLSKDEIKMIGGVKRIIAWRNGNKNPFSKNEVSLLISKLKKGKPLKINTKEKIRKKILGSKRPKQMVQVLEYDKNMNVINSYSSITEASLMTGCSSSKICDVCKGNRKSTKGKIFGYGDGDGKPRFPVVLGIREIDK